MPRDLQRRLAGLLPHGRTLPPEEWERRHGALLGLLWALVAGLVAFALTQGASPLHALVEGALVAAFPLAAAAARRRPRVASAAVAIGLMTASAVLVHVWQGRIEAHFLFFVMVTVLAMYEDWIPFGLAFAYVVLHHGVMGAVDPRSTFDHAAASSQPWAWALVHGFFILCAGVAAVTNWRLNERTRARALRDPLTGLPNRTLFADRLAIALARRQRNPTGTAVLFIDLDHFKAVNDSLGHQAGDRVLNEIAARLEAVVRTKDTVARFGGDEFTVLSEDLTSEGDFLLLAQRIAAAVALPIELDARRVALRASIGIAVARGGERVEDLLRDADAAMYRAKARGRNRVEVAGSAPIAGPDVPDRPVLTA